METGVLPPELRVVPPAATVNEARCYSYAELRDLTGLSDDFWRGEVVARRIAYTMFGRGSRNDRVRVPHPALVAYIADRTRAPDGA